LADRWPSLAAAKREERAGSPALNGVLALMVFGLVVLALPWLRSVNPLLPADRQGFLEPSNPIGAAQYLRSQAPGRIFAPMQWGGYLAWELGRNYPVFVDGRIELYPVAAWSDYFKIAQGADEWASVVDAYGMNYLVVDPHTMDGLVRAVRSAPAWREMHHDEVGIVYARVAR
jgi:hypothetical protein